MFLEKVNKNVGELIGLAEDSPNADSPGYNTDSESIEDDFEEDPKMDPVDYVAADEEEKEEASSDDDEEEEKEHLALADSALPIPDYVPLYEETKPFETDEFEIGESLTVADRQIGFALARGVDYELINTLDASIRVTAERVMTALEEAWAHSEDRSHAIEAEIRALHAK
nr:hypothetical protein [Tanacetum cinerariifolium]